MWVKSMKKYIAYNKITNKVSQDTFNDERTAKMWFPAGEGIAIEIYVPRSFEDLKPGDRFSFVNINLDTIDYVSVYGAELDVVKNKLCASSNYEFIARHNGTVILKWDVYFFIVVDKPYNIS